MARPPQLIACMRKQDLQVEKGSNSPSKRRERMISSDDCVSACVHSEDTQGIAMSVADNTHGRKLRLSVLYRLSAGGYFGPMLVMVPLIEARTTWPCGPISRPLGSGAVDSSRRQEPISRPFSARKPVRYHWG